MFRELIAALTKIFTWWVVIAPWEQGLRIRLGKRVTLLGPGCHLLIPFFDRCYRQATRRRLSQVGPITLTTADSKTITTSGYVGYVIQDMVLLFSSVSQAVDTIDCEAMSHMSDYIATHTLEDCTPGNIQCAVMEKLKPRLEGYGLAEVEFFLANFAVARTLRLITGEVSRWMRDEGRLDTDFHTRGG